MSLALNRFQHERDFLVTQKAARGKRRVTRPEFRLTLAVDVDRHKPH